MSLPDRAMVIEEFKKWKIIGSDCLFKRRDFLSNCDTFKIMQLLLTIDAVMAQSDFTPDRQPRPQDDDKDGELLQAGARKLIDVAACEAVALVIFGHDGKLWEKLKKLPEYYQ